MRTTEDSGPVDSQAGANAPNNDKIWYCRVLTVQLGSMQQTKTAITAGAAYQIRSTSLSHPTITVVTPSWPAECTSNKQISSWTDHDAVHGD